MEFHARMRKMRIVNGKLVVNANIRRNVTAKGDHVFGFDGKKKINKWFRRSVRKSKKSRKTRKSRKFI